jgi:hypothetical protein
MDFNQSVPMVMFNDEKTKKIIWFHCKETCGHICFVDLKYKQTQTKIVSDFMLDISCRAWKGSSVKYYVLTNLKTSSKLKRAPT